MDQGTVEGTGGKSDPYQFDIGKPFFADEGQSNTIEGTFREIPIIDPNENGDIGTGNETGNSGDTSSNGNQQSSTSSGRKTRSDKGKPRGTRSAKTAFQSDLGVGGFSEAIQAIHMALAGIAKCPELELDDEEAQKVTKALDELAAFYNVQPSPQAKVWMNFTGAMSAVYGPRFFAIRARMRKEAENRTKKVVPFPGQQ